MRDGYIDIAEASQKVARSTLFCGRYKYTANLSGYHFDEASEIIKKIHQLERIPFKFVNICDAKAG